MEDSALGVVIVSYNTRRLLAACLASLASELRRQTTGADVWVVDNASTDGSAALATAEHPRARIAALEHNVGYAAACNLALRHWLDQAHGPERFLLLNADVELQPGSIGALLAALDADPGAAIVGPALRYPDGRFQHAAFRFPGIGQAIADLYPLARWYDSPLNGRYPRRLYRSASPFAVDFPLGACMLARRAAVADVGLLDEGYFMYCEEVDWCWRFARRGYRRLCAPAALVVHHGGASTQRMPRAMFVQLWRSRLRLYDRHLPPWRALAVRRVLRLALAGRAAADWLALGRGRIAAGERAARLLDYRRILAP